MPREQLLDVPKESAFPIPSKYVDVVEQTKTNLDNLEESSIDNFIWTPWKRPLSMLYGTLICVELSLHLEKRPLQGYSWVVGRLTKPQVTSRPETLWPEVWSSLSNCARKKAKQ